MAARRPKPRRYGHLTSKADHDFMELARQRFLQASEADTEQRVREQEDLAFYAGEQWPQEILNSRQGLPGNPQTGIPPVPARPSLTINKVREPVRQVLNQERESELGIEIAAADDFGDQTPGVTKQEIELREGLVRRIQRESQAADARSWAFARATIAGRGYYGVMTRVVEGKSFDQEIYLDRFYNQASISLDPAHEQPDGSDAEWGFKGTDLPWARYVAEYGTKDDKPNAVARLSAQEFRALGDELPGWFTASGETRSVRVVEYWYTERVTRALVQLADGRAEYRDALPDDLPEGAIAIDEDGREVSRSVIEKQIKWAKIDGVQILEETDWPGKYIPIVKVVGEELQPFDEERRSEGMVRPARDSQRAYNAMVSKWVEQIGLAPIPPWMGAAGFDEGFETEYALSTTRTLPALHFNGFDLQGRPIAPPARTSITMEIAAIASSVQLFDQAIKSTTAIPDPTLGNIDPSLKSGKAIRQLLDQASKGTSHYLSNLSRSIRYEGLIINDLLYPIYGARKGRLARLMSPQGETTPVLLHQPFVPHPETKAPQAMVNGQPVTATTPGAQTYTLTPDATFNVTVKVTKNFDTRREEQESTIAQLVQAEPQFMSIFGDLLFKYNDGPGHQELEQRATTMLTPAVQALLSGQPVPDPKTQQLEAENQQLKQLLQTKTAEIQAKGQIDLQKTQLQQQGENERAAMDREVKLAVAELNAKIDRMALFLKESELVGARQHEHAQGVRDRVHEAVTQTTDRAHEVGMAAIEHQHALEQADQAHQQTLEQTQQAAALAPPPSANGQGGGAA